MPLTPLYGPSHRQLAELQQTLVQIDPAKRSMIFRGRGAEVPEGFVLNLDEIASPFDRKRAADFITEETRHLACPRADVAARIGAAGFSVAGSLCDTCPLK